MFCFIKFKIIQNYSRFLRFLSPEQKYAVINAIKIAQSINKNFSVIIIKK